MAKKKTSLAVANHDNLDATQKVGSIDIGQMLMAAIDKGMAVETMERIMAMRKELLAEQAKSAFGLAMSAFQGECPVIDKTKVAKNETGVMIYKYAPLESIIAQTKKPIAKYGFSYVFNTQVEKEKVKVLITVKHIGGHSETTDVELPLVTQTRIMNDPQQVAATITFAKRYAFTNAFGIATADEDTDAKGAGEKKGLIGPITQEQKDTIDHLVLTLNITRDDVVKRCKDLYNANYPNINTTQAAGIIQAMKLKLTKQS